MMPDIGKSEGFKPESAGQALQVRAALPDEFSFSLKGHGIEVRYYSDISTNEGSEIVGCFPRLTIFLPAPEVSYKTEIKVAGATLARTVTTASISIAPANVAYRARPTRVNGAVTVIFLDSASMAEPAMILTGLYEPEIIPQVVVEDPLIRGIGARLDMEMTAGLSSPRIYMESLTDTLATHVLTSYATSVLRGQRACTLNSQQLRNSIDFMHTNFDKDISLEELAVAARMSKFHFARAFKLAFGVAPHRYLVNLRTEKARKLLSDNRLSVEEIAQAVGYSDVGHFAAQFRKCMGTTPSAYRRLK
jgi:AraC family transcriptional regulator